MIDRRDFLTTFLGATASAVACKRAPPSPNLVGELGGANFERGHRLREPELRAKLAGPLPVEKVRVAIVGGGPAGLSAAWRLLRAGVRDFVILELEDVAGGTSRGGESAVSRYPLGAHYVPVPGPEARALITLFDELGLVEGREPDGTPIIAEQVLCRAPEERLFYRGTWYEGLYLHAGASPRDLAQFRAFKKELAKWNKWRDPKGRHAFVIPLSRASDDPEVLALDAMSMDAWMRARGFDSPRLRWLVDYGCRDDYALSLEQASAWAGLFYFVSRMGADSQSAELITWPDGNGELVRRLAGSVGDRLRTGMTVGQIDDDGTLGVLDRDGVAKRISAERVIVALPRFVARNVVTSLRGREESAAFDYGAWVVANLHLRDRPTSYGVPFAWDNVLYESKSLGYVVATHQAGRDHGPTVWTWYYAIAEDGKPTREKLLKATHRDWADVAYSDLAPTHREFATLVDRIDVFRWGHAMTRPRVGARVALAKASPATAIGKLHFAHTDLSGVALFEEAHDHGVRAAEEVLAALEIASPTIR